MQANPRLTGPGRPDRRVDDRWSAPDVARQDIPRRAMFHMLESGAFSALPSHIDEPESPRCRDPSYRRCGARRRRNAVLRRPQRLAVNTAGRLQQRVDVVATSPAFPSVWCSLLGDGQSIEAKGQMSQTARLGSLTSTGLRSAGRCVGGAARLDASCCKVKWRSGPQSLPFCDIWPFASMLWPSSAIVSTIRWERPARSRDHVHTLLETVQRYSRETLRTSKYRHCAGVERHIVGTEDSRHRRGFRLVDMRLEEQKCTGL